MDRHIVQSRWAKFIFKYCRIFLLIDVILICVVVYVWYLLCDYNFCVKTPKRASVNILAFGDSMTSGFTRVHGREYHPYSQFLEDTLNRHHSRDMTFRVDNAGVNGDTANGTALSRLKRTLAQKKYDWVVILLGTNDLWKQGKHLDADEHVKQVFHFVQDIFEMSLQKNRMVIVGTLTGRLCEDDTFYFPKCESFTYKRELFNEYIQSFIANSTSTLLLADFNHALPLKTMKNKTRQKYWSDNVHLTAEGYKRMANVIYNKMTPYLPVSFEEIVS